LISHYSSTLRDVCNLSRDATERICIALPEDDPHIFQLFVEWIMYGDYTAGTTALQSATPRVSIDSQAWVLGDRLRSTEFKNYAMGRLYDRYATNFAPMPVTPADVRYAFTNSSANAKIRQIFLDLVTLHFKDPRVQGEIEEWDAIMQEHAELRMHLLLHMRSSSNERTPVLLKKTYMATEEPHVNEITMPANREQVVPAKRTADGVAVTKEPRGG
jgi:hypothetical protein